nr:reverse transcriptase domain-containing protein [Tanacetum cinerariifolium]
VAKVNSSSSTPAISSDVAELKDMVRALLLDKKNQSSAQAPSPTPAPDKVVESNCVTCGGTHSYQNCPATSGNVYQDNIQEYVSQATTANYNQRNTDFRPQMVANQIRPPGFPPVQNNQNNFNRGNNFNQNRGGLKHVKSVPNYAKPVSNYAKPVDQSDGYDVQIHELQHGFVFRVRDTPRALMPNLKLSIPYPLRRDNERRRVDECLALADLGASINLMPLSVWKELSLSELTPTCMTHELADHSVSKPIGIAKDVKVKVAKNNDVTYEACVEYSQGVLGFSDVIASGSPTPFDDPIFSTTSPKLTPFGDSDFLLFEDVNTFLGLEDDPDSSKFDPSYYDPEGDILMLKAILNSDLAPSLPDHEQFVPSFKNELKACKAKMIKSFVDEPPEVELKDLPPHLEYAFLEGDNKLPVIIAKELGDEEKAALIKVLKSHKRAIAWKLSDIQEVEKLLEAGLIYLISDSPWISKVHCVPKKGGFTVVKNEENELIPTRLVTGWRVCIDYRKLNESTRKDHFPLSFMDQMLERLAGNEYYCFLDVFSRYFQIPIDPRDKEKTRFTCPYGTFAYRRMPFGLCNAQGMFQRCMLAIFHDMVEKTMEVFSTMS